MKPKDSTPLRLVRFKLLAPNSWGRLGGDAGSKSSKEKGKRKKANMKTQ